jgi:hypothetical protein
VYATAAAVTPEVVNATSTVQRMLSDCDYESRKDSLENEFSLQGTGTEAEKSGRKMKIE